MRVEQRPQIGLIEAEKLVQEKCGIVAVFSPEPHAKLPLTLIAARGGQHRGQAAAGLATSTREGVRVYRGDGNLHDVFTPEVVEKYDVPSWWEVVHMRYGTDGDNESQNLQPFVVKADDGSTLVTAHNGQFAGKEKMMRRVRGEIPEGASDTYIFTQLLAQAEGRNWEEKILNTLATVDGAYSIIIGVNEKLFAARDKHGIRPLIFGRVNGDFMVASETASFDKVGGKVIRELKKGEVLRFAENGPQVIQKESTYPNSFCDFEWAYFSRPDSLMPTHENPDDSDHPERWLSAYWARNQQGRMLAEKYPIPNADFVVGTPDSGVALAIGYANAMGFDYQQAILRQHDQRIFMTDDKMDTIKDRVKGKLSLVPDLRVWEGKIVVVGDDSLVRGTVSEKVTEQIFEMGAKEVHWVVGFPPISHTCHLGVSMRTESELIAARHNVDPFNINSREVAEEIGATSVSYITPEDLIRSRKPNGEVIIPNDSREIFLANGGCGGCITGLYPVDKEGNVHVSSGIKDVKEMKLSKDREAVLVGVSGWSNPIELD